MSSITFKRFSPKDADAVSQLFRGVYGTRYPQPDVYLPTMIGQQNARRRWYSLLAWDAKELVGHAALYRLPGDTHQAELALLVVHPEARGQRTATRLSQALLARAGRLHLTTLHIKQVTSHPYTQRLARHIGFHNCGVLPDYVTSPFDLAPQETMVMGCQMIPGHARPLPEVHWLPDCRALMEPLLLAFGTESRRDLFTDMPMTTLYQQHRVEVQIQCLDRRVLAQLGDFPRHWLLSLKLNLSLSFNQDLEQLSARGFSFNGLMPAPGPSGWLALFHRGAPPRTLYIDCPRMQRLAHCAAR